MCLLFCVPAEWNARRDIEPTFTAPSQCTLPGVESCCWLPCAFAPAANHTAKYVDLNLIPKLQLSVVLCFNCVVYVSICIEIIEFDGAGELGMAPSQMMGAPQHHDGGMGAMAPHGAMPLATKCWDALCLVQALLWKAQQIVITHDIDVSGLYHLSLQ